MTRPRPVAVGIVSAPAPRAHLGHPGLRSSVRFARAFRARGSATSGAAIQGHAEELGYSIVREFVGHGIGRAMHEPPSVPNHGREGSAFGSGPGWCWRSSPC